MTFLCAEILIDRQLAHLAGGGQHDANASPLQPGTYRPGGRQRRRWILWRHSGRRRHHAHRGQHSHRGRHQDFRHVAQSAVARRGTHLGATGVKNPPRCARRYFGEGGL